jgi:hypothetical protein
MSNGIARKMPDTMAIMNAANEICPKVKLKSLA